MKLNTWMMAAALSLLSAASAQTWETDYGKATLIGCYGKQDGVYCDLNFVLTKKQTQQLSWYSGNWKIYKPDGTSQEADKIAFIDGKFGSYSSTQDIIANVPVKLQLYFNTPSSISGFRALAFKDTKFDNIPVRPYGSAPTTPTELPAAAGVKGFAIALSNCQLQDQKYVCTAVLTPTK